MADDAIKLAIQVMLNPYNTGGNILGLFQGDPKYKVKGLVKNPLLQTKIDAVGTDYDEARAMGENALNDYIRDYLAGGKVAKARSEQEQGVLEGFYDGRVENELATLRKSRADAARSAVDRALGYATANQNTARLGRDGGGSSYDTRLAMKTAADIETSNAMENAALERGDWDYLMRQRLNMTGARQALSDALLQRDLVPSDMTKRELNWNVESIGDLLKLDQSNKIYGVQEDKDFLDKMIDYSYKQGQEFDKDMAVISSMMGSARGGSGSAMPTASGAGASAGATQSPWALGPGY